MVNPINPNVLDTLPDMLGRALLIHITMHGQQVAHLRARLKTWLNLLGGLPRSFESSRTPMIHFR